MKKYKHNKLEKFALRLCDIGREWTNRGVKAKSRLGSRVCFMISGWYLYWGMDIYYREQAIKYANRFRGW